MVMTPARAAQKTAIIAWVANGGSVTDGARTLGIARSTASHWIRAAGLHSVRAPHPAQVAYAAARAQGHSYQTAAAAVGIHPRTAQDWEHGIRKSRNSRFHPDGRRISYTTGQTTMEPMRPPDPALDRVEQPGHPRFLSLTERERIADLHRQGHSLRAIGRALSRPPSTISRELRRNQEHDGAYQPYAAQRRTVARRSRPKPAKLAQPGPLREYVRARLQERWSPEQISHALPQAFPDEEAMRVSTETIYQALYVQARGGLKRELESALRSGRTRRKAQKTPTQRTSRFTDPMLMIRERPPDVEDRAVPGHWEGDLILGTGNRSAIVTLVERTTRYVMLGYLSDGHTAEAVQPVLSALIQTLPAHLRRSLTWDQGAEMAQHRAFRLTTGVPVYFCDPSSPWQRGSNENTNGLLRQYFPKGTDLAVHPPEELARVADELNRRPRKTLGWDTPATRMHRFLTDPASPPVLP